MDNLGKLDRAVLWLAAVILLLLASAVVDTNFSALMQSKELNDALRTIATVGGFGVALAAYLRWRRPDDRKRQADTAQLILRASGEMEAATEAVRPQWLWVNFHVTQITAVEREEALAMLEFSEEPINHLRTEIVRFGAYLAEARVLYGLEVSTLMLAFHRDCQRVLQANDRAKQLLVFTGTQQKPPGYDREVREVLSTLGIRVISDYQLNESAERDLFGETLKESGEKFRDALAEYVRPMRQMIIAR